MMLVKAGSTDVTTYFHLRLAADGTDATGLSIANIDLTYVRTLEEPAAKVDAQALADQDTAHTDNFAIEVDGTNMPGVYRVDWPDAAFAAGAREVILTVKVATAFTESQRVQLAPAPADVTLIEGADPTDTIRDAVVDDATRIDASALNTASATTIPAILVDTGTDIPASIADLPTSAELATALGTADDAVLAAIAALNNLSSSQAATAVLTTQMTQSYAANGTAPTLAQAIFAVHQALMDFAIAGTDKTVRQLNGSDTAFVITHDDENAPTAATRT